MGPFRPIEPTMNPLEILFWRCVQLLVIAFWWLCAHALLVLWPPWVGRRARAALLLAGMAGWLLSEYRYGVRFERFVAWEYGGFMCLELGPDPFERWPLFVSRDKLLGSEESP